MEFYPQSYPNCISSSQFQFPTGWNSTCSPSCCPYLPIGFNSQRDGILQLAFRFNVWSIASFNSQRDGILPALSFSFCRAISCFNSQRDGILLAAPCRACSIVLGFNSQRDGILLYNRSNISREFFKVSIPNGMEFYGIKTLCSTRV